LRKKIKQAKHFCYYIVAIIIGNLFLCIPRRIALVFGLFIGNLIFYFSQKERKKALNNLYIAFGSEKSNEKIQDICHKYFKNLGKGLIEFLQLPKLKPYNLNKLVDIEGKENLDNALKKGKGAIILTAHLGNWELTGASFPLLGYKTSTIVRPEKLNRIDQWVNKRREGTGLKCIGRGSSIKNALQCLKRNELLGILPDVDTKVDGVFVDFFGKPAYTPRGPVSIAIKTGCDILPAFMIRQKDDRHKLIIEKPIELKITGNIEEDIRYNTETFTKIIESYIREYPDQWIWTHNRWKTQERKPF
jgi:KDO2-lipid IV(A) lauroyltransferase